MRLRVRRPLYAQTVKPRSDARAGAVASAAGYGGHHDIFRADRVWLCAVILTVGYMVSRGLAKSGSRDPYTEER